MKMTSSWIHWKPRNQLTQTSKLMSISNTAVEFHNPSHRCWDSIGNVLMSEFLRMKTVHFFTMNVFAWKMTPLSFVQTHNGSCANMAKRLMEWWMRKQTAKLESVDTMFFENKQNLCSQPIFQDLYLTQNCTEKSNFQLDWPQRKRLCSKSSLFGKWNDWKMRRFFLVGR